MKCYWKELLTLLPPELRAELEEQTDVREIRMRRGAPAQLRNGRGFRTSRTPPVTPADLHHVVNLAARYSAYASDTLAQTFLTAPGGHRIGLCGTAVLRQGKMTGLRELQSVCIRVARDIPGCAGNLADRIGTDSVLILGPPGSGKTTLLRDLIRSLSNRGQAVAVADERCELFPPAPCGEYGFSPGVCTDILSGAGKPEAIERLVRTMGPERIAVDEITSVEDCRCMEQSGCCGVSFLATCHAESQADLVQRPVYRQLAETGLFRWVVVLKRDQTFTMEELKL